MSEARVDLRVSDTIAQIVLARTEARNAIDPAWVDGLAKAVDACAGSDDIRVVVLSAGGAAFTVGGDLQHFAARIDDLPAELDRMIGTYHRALRTLAELPVPVICAAHGAIAGGGIGLLWSADVVLLADDAKIATGFARLGLSGDGGSTWYLPRLVGQRRATQLLMEGRVLTAADAVDWGLADRVLGRDDLAQTTMELARSLAGGPTAAYGEMRRLIRQSMDLTLSAGLDAEQAAVVRCATTHDAREGIRSFLQRRPPGFSGR